jgi:hypothetical protein
LKETIKEEFVANVIQVKMHLYIACHAARVANAIVAYQAKHDIVNNDMV